MPVVEYITSNFAYIKNDYNRCQYLSVGVNNEPFNRQVTGWHFVPNSRWGDYLNDSQWFDLVTNHEHCRVLSIDIALSNMIPMTDQLSIQQNTTFLSFNNTIYALAYDDTCYETVASPTVYDSINNIFNREGVTLDTASGNVQKEYLPQYTHLVPTIEWQNGPDSTRVPLPLTSYFWDPLTRPGTIMELRPGKNSINYHWECAGSDKHIWYNLCSGLLTTNTSDGYTQSTHWIQNYGVNEAFTDYRFSVLTPTKGEADMMCNEARALGDFKSLERFNKKYNVGTALYSTQMGYKFPIRNFFIKMIPLFDAKNALVKHEAQVLVTKKIKIEVSQRKSAVNAPRMEGSWMNFERARQQPQSNRAKKQLGLPKATYVHNLHQPDNNPANSWPNISTPSTAKAEKKTERPS